LDDSSLQNTQYLPTTIEHLPEWTWSLLDTGNLKLHQVSKEKEGYVDANQVANVRLASLICYSIYARTHLFINYLEIRSRRKGGYQSDCFHTAQTSSQQSISHHFYSLAASLTFHTTTQPSTTTPTQPQAHQHQLQHPTSAAQ
jgi:hypothetical protein